MTDWLIYREEPFKLHSGGKSHWFVDGQALFNDLAVRESVLACWEEAFRADKRNLINPRVRGIPEGGLCWAEAFAERIGAPYDGVGLGDGPPYPGGFVDIVIDDVCTTGHSFTCARGHLRFAVVDRSDGKWGDPPERMYPPVTAWASIWLPIEEAGK